MQRQHDIPAAVSEVSGVDSCTSTSGRAMNCHGCRSDRELAHAPLVWRWSVTCRRRWSKPNIATYEVSQPSAFEP